MVQWLRTLAALAEDPGSIPGTHMAANDICNSISKDLTPSSVLHRHPAPKQYTCRKETST